MNQEQLKEYIKCAKDPVYFINGHGYAFNIEKGSVSKIKCFTYQEEFLRNLKNEKNNIVLKSRQTGLSVITAAFIVWKLIFGIDERILIVADNHAGAVRFLNHVKIFLENIPKYLQPDERLVDNTKEIKFSNGCWVKAVASSKHAGRGETLTMLVLDETAFIEHSDDIWMGAGLALAASGGKCVMISTPKGTSGLYHKTWVGAEKKENNFKYFRAHWSEHPVFSKGVEEKIDEEGNKYLTSPWYEKECERLHHDKVKIAQELDLSFEGSGAAVIDSMIIERYSKQCINTKPICYYNYKQESNKFVNDETVFHVWQKPREEGNYIIGGDVGRGDGSDFSTLQVIDADNLVQVAEYQGKVAPDEFAKIIYKVAKDYNEAYVAIECNSFGLATTLMLKNVLNYKENRMYHTQSVTKLYNRTNDFMADRGETIPGFQTSTKTRPILISALIKHMNSGQVKINSHRLIDEFKTFVYKNDKAEHEKGFNDDLIFAFAIAMLMRDTEIDNVFWNKKIVKAMLEGISYSSTKWGEDKSDKDKYIEDTKWLYGPISSS